MGYVLRAQQGHGQSQEVEHRPPAAPPLSAETGTTARVGLVLRVEQDYGYLLALAHHQRAVLAARLATNAMAQELSHSVQ